FIILTLLLLGGGIWFLFRILGNSQEDYAEWNKLLPTFSVVPNIPSGNFPYTGEAKSTWSVVLAQSPEDQDRLNDLLTKPVPEIAATFNYEPSDEPIRKLQSENKFFFAMTSLEKNIPDGFNKEHVAYDGLLVFVTFTKKDGNIPTALKGQIALEDLQKIYTGKIKNWKDIGGPDLLILPYAPLEPEARSLFKKLVLKDDPQNIADFEKIIKEETKVTQRQISSQLKENKIPGIISFGILSKTWDQCSGYPLAIKFDSKNAPIQPLFRDRERRPINPSDNLCDKRNYLDVNTFKTGKYPLGYPLFVVYPKDNSRPTAGPSFASLLKTRQGQCLLSKVGLVPLQSIPKDYVCKSLP
ncbi:MAG: substrate-binding domain-containing protein, partial [Scytonema sp. PMC 1069.18]|nr:substrate-binding domain-containing protein [Scytonema sp. PMC 1069.18]